MNINKVSSGIRKYANDNGYQVQEVWDKFFFDEFLLRLTNSIHVDKFILKGGFLFEKIATLSNRTTLDVDFSYKIINVTKEHLKKEITEIISNQDNSLIYFELRDINEINEQEKYQGYRVRINYSFENIKSTFNIDIATGDAVTPAPNVLTYNSIITGKSIKVNSYNAETILAEKFQTIISINVNNTRMKDFFDIFILVRDNLVNSDSFHDAFINTFENRGTNYDQIFIRETIDKVKKSVIIESLYNNYSSKTSFAKFISFEMVVDALEEVYKYIKYQEKLSLKMKSLIIVRHGEDEQDKLGGWSDNKLTKLGIDQAHDLKDTLKRYLEDDVILISSDLTRAKETSEIIFLNSNFNIIYDERFRETNNGDFKNMLVKDFIENHKNYIFSRLEMKQTYPNGESPFMFYNRIKNAINEISEKYSDKKIILVTHGGVYGVIKSLIEGVRWTNKQRYRLNNAEFRILI